MKLLEVKNNLVKIAYKDDENLVLGNFIVLVTEEKSYVAQFVNLKSEEVGNFAIAKLLFTFTGDGVVDNYDGSAPAINSEVMFLPSDELLRILPSETPIKIGDLAQQDCMLTIDISAFENNLTVYAERDIDKRTFISNCVRQIFQKRERSVIIDYDNIFEDYERIELSKDFKLPLNAEMIDYIFEYELSEVDPSTKALIQDIFYEVQKYIKTLENGFLPIKSFIDVVANQYKEMQMPELALLKNKLLKYSDANIFANKKEEFEELELKLKEKNCVIVNLKDINDSLQKKVISYIHKTLETFDRFTYYFAPLNNDNSDKKLIKQLINNNHVFTIFLTDCSYKYLQELQHHAQNVVLFAPDNTTDNFVAFNTFISKLNMNECIVYGKLTQGIPFIVTLNDLELDLTLEDVLGDKYQFIPMSEAVQIVQVDEFGNKTPVNFETNQEIIQNEEYQEVEQFENYEEEEQFNQQDEINITPEIIEQEIEIQPITKQTQEQLQNDVIQQSQTVSERNSNIEDFDYDKNKTTSPIKNILANTTENNTNEIIDNPQEDSFEEIDDLLDESELIIEEGSTSENFSQNIDFQQPQNENLTESDLDIIEETQKIDEDVIFEDIDQETNFENPPYVEQEPQDVPIYPAEEPDQRSASSSEEFNQGDQVSHPRYGRGVVEKIIKYGNKTLCSITFENVGRRLLDPTISELTKID